MNTNWKGISGQWLQHRDGITKQWGKLTEEEVLEIAGNRDSLLVKIQEKYGISKDQASRQIDKWAEKAGTL